MLAPTTVTINAERRLRPPYGVHGSAPGKRGLNVLVRGGNEQVVSGKHTAQLEAGDRVIIKTPGGGGWGDASASKQK